MNSTLRRASLSVAICAGLLLAAPAVADERKQQVDALFQDVTRSDGPGMAVGIYQDGQLAFANGYGLADLDQQTPITPQTAFRAASVSKQFTAFSIALLARDGKIDLDADIHKYLPELPDYGAAITVRDLVYHISGFKDSNLIVWLGNRSTADRVGNRVTMALLKRQKNLLFAPGTRFSYSNSGYLLLAEIVRAASGQTLRQFAAARIFEPLGMKNTFFQDDATEIVPRRAHSYSRDKSGWRQVLYNNEFTGPTGLVTTIEDMAKWIGNFDRPVVGDAALIAQITSQGYRHDGTKLNYAFGLTLESSAGREAVTHSGSIAGYRALVTWLPKERFGVVMLANHPADEAARTASIIELYLGKAAVPVVPPATQSQPIEITPDQLQALTGHYLGPKIWSADLVVENGKLMWLSAVLPKSAVTLRADDYFTRGSGDAARHFRWVRDPNGKVRGFRPVSSFGGSEDEGAFERIRPVTPSAAALRELEGDYHVDEVDTSFTFFVQDGQLRARSLWLGNDVKLTPVAHDRFDADSIPIGSIAVTRNKAGKPTGFEIVGGGMVGTRFEKVATGK